MHATELEGAERDEKYALQAQRYPGFADYEHKTSRTIPVVALTPTGAGAAHATDSVHTVTSSVASPRSVTLGL